MVAMTGYQDPTYQELARTVTAMAAMLVQRDETIRRLMKGQRPKIVRGKKVYFPLAEAIALYEAGQSLEMIGRARGYTSQAVHYQLKRAGVPLRGRGHSKYFEVG